jgi:hypothetical protein
VLRDLEQTIKAVMEAVSARAVYGVQSRDGNEPPTRGSTDVGRTGADLPSLCILAPLRRTWKSRMKVELLDPIHAQPSALSNRFLGQPRCQAMLSEQVPQRSNWHRTLSPSQRWKQRPRTLEHSY